MGFNSNGTKLLLYAKSKGVDFGKTITIGRQGLHLDESTLRDNFDESGIKGADAATLLRQEKGYAEPFLKALGAKEVHSLDASDYESATIVHDMNQPIPEKYKAAYDVVIDGGSLEHIFNFPVAIRNCMEMVKVGGHFMGLTPCNNFFGHGFYQFSPELYFRIFSKENGFEMKTVIFYNDKKNSGWYEVKDPNEVKSRVTLSSGSPSYLFVMAKKISAENIFSKTPQQSDYQNILWDVKNNENPIQLNQRSVSITSKVSNMLSHFFSFFSETGTGNKNFFKKIQSK